MILRWDPRCARFINISVTPFWFFKERVPWMQFWFIGMKQHKFFLLNLIGIKDTEFLNLNKTKRRSFLKKCFVAQLHIFHWGKNTLKKYWEKINIDRINSEELISWLQKMLTWLANSNFETKSFWKKSCVTVLFSWKAVNINVFQNSRHRKGCLLALKPFYKG